MLCTIHECRKITLYYTLISSSKCHSGVSHMTQSWHIHNDIWVGDSFFVVLFHMLKIHFDWFWLILHKTRENINGIIEIYFERRIKIVCWVNMVVEFLGRRVTRLVKANYQAGLLSVIDIPWMINLDRNVRLLGIGVQCSQWCMGIL